MNKRLPPKLFLAAFCAAGLLCLPVFVVAIVRDWQAGDMQWFELAARLLGYALALLTYGFGAAGAYRLLTQGQPGRPARVASGLILTSIVLLCVHDVLLYAAYGNQLEGTLTMAAFFVLDVLLAALHPLSMHWQTRRPTSRLLRAVLLALALTWAVYIAGDMAGYPAARLTDWDEPLIKLAPLLHALLLWYSARETEQSR